MKALSLTIQKLWPLLKFVQINRQTNAQAKNYMPPIYAGAQKRENNVHWPQKSVEKGTSKLYDEF